MAVPPDEIEHVYSIYINADAGSGLARHHRWRRDRRSTTTGRASTPTGRSARASATTIPTGRSRPMARSSSFEPPTRLEMTFLARWDPEVEAEGPIRHLWELEPEDGATKLTVTHAGPQAGLQDGRELRQRDHLDRVRAQDVRRGWQDGGRRRLTRSRLDALRRPSRSDPRGPIRSTARLSRRDGAAGAGRRRAPGRPRAGTAPPGRRGRPAPPRSRRPPSSARTRATSACTSRRPRALLSGLVPYRDFAARVPAARARADGRARALVWPFGQLTLDTYPWLFAAWEARAHARPRRGPRARSFGSAVMAADDGDDRARWPVRLTIVRVGAALALTWRFDLFPALLVMVALWAALAGRPACCGHRHRDGRAREALPARARARARASRGSLPLDIRRLTRFGVAAAADRRARAASRSSRWPAATRFGFLSYQAQRGLQVESIGGGLAVLGGLIGGQPVEMSYGFSAVQVEGDFARRGWPPCRS